MTTLQVHRLSATVHGPGDGGRVDRMLRRLADRRLEEALRGVTLPPGRWCVRRVDVPIRLDPDSSDAVVEAEWARRLIAGLRRALAEHSPDVVHYRHEREALADLVACVATGRFEHAWAWSGLDLLPIGRPAPGDPPATTILAALRRQPSRASAAVVSAVRRAGAPAVDRALGVTGWTAVAALVRSAVAPASMSRRPTSLGRPTTSVARLAATLVRSSALATAFRAGSGARLRPSAATRAAWAVLVVAEADPALLSGPPTSDAALVDAVAELLSPAVVVPPVRAPRPALLDGAPGPAAAMPGRELATGPAPAAAQENDIPRATAALDEPADPLDTARPPRPESASPAIHSHRGRSAEEPATELSDRAEPPASTGFTIWAGLLFLLAVAEDAAIPATIVDDPVLAARPLRWTLHAIARTLVPAAHDDPAVLALAGLAPDSPPPSELGDPGTPVERARVGELAGQWTAALADRMPEPPEVETLARRIGRIVADPGWIDVHLRLDEVDVDVRRAGLDLDPGWVPWLGTVVRFRYA